MGLFGSGKTCSVCGEKANSLFASNLADGCICFTCKDLKLKFGILINPKNYTVADCHALLEAKNFGDTFYFDDNKQMCFIKGTRLISCNYSDILSFDLLEDQESVSSGGLGRAAVGGVLFGGVGAVVGSVTGNKKAKTICNSLAIKLTVKNNEQPTIYLDFISKATKKDSSEYKNTFKAAQDCLSQLQLICNKQQTTPIPTPSSADEILKFKTLLDTGIITQEEFDKKKKQLLGL